MVMFCIVCSLFSDADSTLVLVICILALNCNLLVS